MRTSNLFAMALAAVSFAACSNDDAPAAGGENQGELVDAISVYFTNPKGTYAYDESVMGEETENNVYDAFIFAKENNPEHPDALVGDWTVKEAKVDGGGAIPPSGEAGKSLKSMATFSGVRQGDNVYVIANDPNMTMAIAEGLAHQAKKSETAIQEYISTLSKEYLNGLAVKKGAKPTGHFIMAGKATIPTSPSQPNNTTMRVPVTLDREVAKVSFSAKVTGVPDKEAYKKVQIKDGDGLIIARIPRQVSFYTKHERDWYFPLVSDEKAKDWGTDWKVAFNGEEDSAPGKTEADKIFNNVANVKGEIKDLKEYRYTWNTDSKLITYNKPGDKGEVDGGQITSPFFYVTPNYADNSACATVIVTQATYVGDNTLVGDVTKEILEAALKDKSFTDAGINAFGSDAWNYKDEGATVVSDNLTKLYAFLTSSETYKDVFKDYKDAESLIDYKKGQKVYYRADVSNYTDDNLNSLNVTERNTFYSITGTITSLGAKTVEAAIENDNLGMTVEVTVNPWKVVINMVDM